MDKNDWPQDILHADAEVLADFIMEGGRDRVLHLVKQVQDNHKAGGPLAFFNHVAHELRTPMVTLQGYMEMLQRRRLGPLTPQQEHGVGVAYRQVQALSARLDLLLDYTRTLRGLLTMDSSAHSIEDVVEDCVERARHEAERRHCLLNLTRRVGHIEVVLDLSLFSRALDALLQRAIKARADKELTVELFEEPTHTRVRITPLRLSADELRGELACDPFACTSNTRADLDVLAAQAVLGTMGFTLSAFEHELGSGFEITMPNDQ